MIYVVETLYNICLNQSIDLSPSLDFEKEGNRPRGIESKKDPQKKDLISGKGFRSSITAVCQHEARSTSTN